MAIIGVFGVLGLFLLASLSILNPQAKSTSSKKSSLDSLSTVIVARVGPVEVSAREFLTSYEVGPAFVKRNDREAPRVHHLDLMIKEKIMALDGFKLGVLDDAAFGLMLNEIRADRAVEEMYKEDILTQVEIDEQTLDQAAEEYAIQVWFRYVQLDTEEQVHAVRNALESGASFDSLSVSGHDPVSQNPITFWEIKQRDHVLANALAKLDVGEISDVVKTPHGFFLLRVDNVFKDPFTTPAKYAEARRKVGVKVRQLEADSLAFDYAASRMEAVQPVIKREAFNQLFAFFESLDATGSRDVAGVLMGNWPGALDRSGAEEVMPVTLLETTEGDYTVSDFLDWYDLRRFPVEGRSAGARANQLKSIIWRMLRDRLLANEATDRGFAVRPVVVEEVEWWREKMSFWELREHLLAELVPTDLDIEQVMAEYPHRYTSEDPDKNRKQAFKDVYTLREREVLHAYFAEMQEVHDIWVDTLALLSLPIQTDKLSKPIEVVAFKKEGTFPRIAYPTIDRVWERY